MRGVRTCMVGMASLSPVKLSLMWSRRFRSSALWWARRSSDMSRFPDPFLATTKLYRQYYYIGRKQNFEFIFLNLYKTQGKRPKHQGSKFILNYQVNVALSRSNKQLTGLSRLFFCLLSSISRLFFTSLQEARPYMIFSTQSEGTQKSSGMALSNVHTHKYIMCAQARKSTHTMATLWWWRILVKNMQTHPRENHGMSCY